MVQHQNRFDQRDCGGVHGQIERGPGQFDLGSSKPVRGTGGWN